MTCPSSGPISTWYQTGSSCPQELKQVREENEEGNELLTHNTFPTFIQCFHDFTQNSLLELQGDSNPYTVDRIKDFAIRLNPHIICLVETKIDTSRVLKFCKIFHKNWDGEAIPASGLLGGVIVLWNKNYGEITPILGVKTSLHLVISSISFSWILSIVYNSQRSFYQTSLWKSLSAFSSLKIPWIVARDFNAIASPMEHKRKRERERECCTLS